MEASKSNCLKDRLKINPWPVVSQNNCIQIVGAACSIPPLLCKTDNQLERLGKGSNDAFPFIDNAPDALTICDLILELINESGSFRTWIEEFQKAAFLLQHPAVPLLRVVHQVNHSATEGYRTSSSQKWHSPASLSTPSREADPSRQAWSSSDNWFNVFWGTSPSNNNYWVSIHCSQLWSSAKMNWAFVSST